MFAARGQKGERGSNMTRWLSVVAVVLALAVLPARADEKSHRKAAEELFETMDLQKYFQGAVDTMLKLQLKANPAVARYRDVLKKFLDKHMSYASLKEDLVRLYTKEFTEEELKELARFNRTPTGKKFMQKSPGLLQKATEAGAQRVQDELKKLVEGARKDKK
jgi:hypothetical protein